MTSSPARRGLAEYLVVLALLAATAAAGAWRFSDRIQACFGVAPRGAPHGAASR